VSTSLRVSNIRFVPAPARLRSTGLHGWATLTIDDAIDIGYIAVRRTIDRRLVLAFPERREPGGYSRSIVRPLDQAARDVITERVIAELRRRRVIT